MTRFHLLGSTLFLLAAVGCATPPSAGGDRAVVNAAVPIFHLDGIVAESSACTNPLTCTEFGFSVFSKTVVGNASVRAKLHTTPKELIISQQIVKMTVKQAGNPFFNYKALIGPNPGSSADVTGWLENTDPTIELGSEGWALAAGSQPRVKSDWVSAGADGSTILLQKVSETLQRFFYLEGAAGVTAKVVCLADPTNKRYLNTPGTYIEILTAECDYNPPTPDPSDPEQNPTLIISTAPQEVQDFVNYAVAAAASSS